MFAIPWLTVGLAGAAVVGAAVLGYAEGRSDANAKHAAALAQQAEDAREKEKLMSWQYAKVKDKQDAELQSANDRLAAAVGQLHNRPASRLPGPAREACKGTSGAELSRRDATFLARLAARARALQIAYVACEEKLDVIYGQEAPQSRRKEP